MLRVLIDILARPSLLQYTFPKDVGAAAREKRHLAPGPGHYNIPPGVGKQVRGHNRSGVVRKIRAAQPVCLKSQGSKAFSR